MPWASCDKCAKRFWGSNPKYARDQLNRHKREAHTRGRVKIEARRAAHQKWKRARATAPTVVFDLTLAAFVLCPIRREAAKDMFSETRDHLASSGFAAAQVHRMQGIDLENPPTKYQGKRLPDPIHPSRCVMVACHSMFLKKAIPINVSGDDAFSSTKT